MTDKRDATADIRIDSSLSKKVSKGALWMTLGIIFGRSLNIISAIILARLLEPEDFGLMAIAMSIIGLSQTMSSTGFESALIQKQDSPGDLLNTAWTFELARHLILFIVVFLAAPWFATFFNEPRAVAILRVISLSLVLQGLRNIGVVYFRKNLDFQKQFVLDIVSLMAYICVVIPLAFWLRNVWALVWANIISSLASCSISYVMHPYRPRLEFSIKKASNLFKFGKWVLGFSIVGAIREQGMPLFIGKFLGIPILGLYNRAGTFSTMIFQQVNVIVWKVGYPAYSQLQLDPDRFKQAYLKTLQLLTFIGIPMAGGLFILSGDFVHLFLTDKWLPVVPLIQILCLKAIFDFINSSAHITFLASGKPSIATNITFFSVIILVIIVYPLSSKWGATGAVASLFLSVLLSSPIISYMVIRVIRCTFAEFFKPVSIALINTSIMVFTITIFKQYVFNQIYIQEFFFLIFIGTTIYLTFSCFFERYMNYGIYKLIKTRIAVFM